MNPFRLLIQWLRGSFVESAGGGNLIGRVWRTAVIWSWGLNALRLGSVLVVLPLLTQLPEADFGFLLPAVEYRGGNATDRYGVWVLGGTRGDVCDGRGEATQRAGIAGGGERRESEFRAALEAGAHRAGSFV